MKKKAARLTETAVRPRVLTEAELRQVVGIDQSAREAIESAFGWLEDGRVSIPPIRHIAAGERGDVDVKGAFVDGLPYFAIKIASGFLWQPGARPAGRQRHDGAAHRGSRLRTPTQ